MIISNSLNLLFVRIFTTIIHNCRSVTESESVKNGDDIHPRIGTMERDKEVPKGARQKGMTYRKGI